MKTLIVALALLLSISGCNSDPKAAASQQTDAQTVEVVPVASQKLVTVFTLPAQLIPFETVDIYQKVTGCMDMIRVDGGSRVHKGELIIRLSAPELVAQRAQAESALRAAESQLTTAQAKLAADNGTYLHLASAAKTPGVVAENDVMVATQTASPPQGQVQPADTKYRVMSVELDANYADGRLSPGSFISVQWPVDRALPTLFVPVSAVTNDQQRTFVERVRNGKAEWVDVVTGLSVSGNIEVFGDLQPGDQVIRNATDAIRPEQQVKAASTPKPASADSPGSPK